MPTLTIPDVDDRTLDALRQRAKRHGRSIEVEAQHILTEAARAVPASSWAAVDAIREQLAGSGRTFGDSTEDVREDRAR
jgi:antitoxin FitA